ncbi:ankyrin repeat-containing domain protein [Geopyxis carbonaria]|nr:ankyrin repeat-containing domain protein [Geopyxis carbonaria]
MSADTSIKDVYDQCEELFRGLRHTTKSVSKATSGKPTTIAIDVESLTRENVRFTNWARNVGAHRSDRVSLEYRLREASRLKAELINIMMELKDTLSEVLDVVSGNRIPYDADEDYTSQDDSSSIQTTEIEERFIDINHYIICLYKFSISIRNPAPRDKREKWSAIDMSFYESFDIGHIRDKFPETETFLYERLGKANCRRRQLLAYNEKHNAKISRRFPVKTEREVEAQVLRLHEGVDTVDDRHNARNDARNDAPQVTDTLPWETTSVAQTQTTVSTVRWQANAHQNYSQDADNPSSDAISVTSYASSINENSGNLLHVPQPPEPDAFDGVPFICPFCHAQTLVANDRAWKSHVFRDIRPYVCTFENCSTASHLFETRHQWFNHELDEHRREWFCNSGICKKTFKQHKDLEDHLRRRHDAVGNVDIIIDRCERTAISLQKCPLCPLRMSVARIQGHLGRHLQQIALFALPGAEEDSDSGEENDTDPEDQEAEGSDNEVEKDEKDEKEKPAAVEDSDNESDFEMEPGDENLTLPKAAEAGKLDLVKHLLKTGVDVNMGDGGTDVTALHYCAIEGHTEIANLLLNNGANVNCHNGVGSTALMELARMFDEDKTEIAKMLIKHGADVNAKDFSGSSALSLAAYHGYATLISLLLDHGADIETREEQTGNTPLTYCLAKRRTKPAKCEEIMRILIDRGANVNATNDHGETALMLAAEKGSPRMVTLLLDRGADVNAKDSEGQTALSIAGDGAVADLLKSRGAL